MKKILLSTLIAIFSFNINLVSYSETLNKPSVYKDYFRSEYVRERSKSEIFILYSYSSLLGDSKKEVIDLYSKRMHDIKITNEKISTKYSLLYLGNSDDSFFICYVLDNKEKIIGYFLPERLYLGGIQNKIELIKPIQQLDEDNNYLSGLNITIPNNVTFKVYKKVSNGFVENYSLVGKTERNIEFLVWDAFYPAELDSFFKKYAKESLQEFINFIAE